MLEHLYRLAAAAVACSLAPSLAFAVDKPVKQQEFTTTTATIAKKATTVKKQKKVYRLIYKKQGYIRFTAPATRTYKFKFYNLKGKSVYSSFVSSQAPDKRSPEYSFMVKVATKGGKTNTLWLATKGHQSKTGDMVNRNLLSRTAKIKLAKGQRLFFYFYSGSENKNSVNLKVS